MKRFYKVRNREENLVVFVRKICRFCKRKEVESEEEKRSGL